MKVVSSIQSLIRKCSRATRMGTINNAHLGVDGVGKIGFPAQALYRDKQNPAGSGTVTLSV